jgi:hypothetical protein
MNLAWISSALVSSARSPDELRAISHFGPNDRAQCRKRRGPTFGCFSGILQPFSTFCTNEANRQNIMETTIQYERYNQRVLKIAYSRNKTRLDGERKSRFAHAWFRWRGLPFPAGARGRIEGGIEGGLRVERGIDNEQIVN